MLLSLEFSREDELRGTELEAYWDEGCKLFVCSVFLLENADSQSMQVSLKAFSFLWEILPPDFLCLTLSATGSKGLGLNFRSERVTGEVQCSVGAICFCTNNSVLGKQAGKELLSLLMMVLITWAA